MKKEDSIYLEQDATSLRLEKELSGLKSKGNYRTLKYFNKPLVNLSSNDYIGLGEALDIREDFFKLYGQLSFSSSSSRLLSGNYQLIVELEDELRKIYRKESLVFNSGFDANQCVIETIFQKNSLIISDKLNHASIYSGILGTTCKLVRYPHLDYVALEQILQKESTNYDEIVVISETIYSMDGDIADLNILVELKKKYKFKLFIDEAHSYGVYGYGVAYSSDLLEYIDYLIIPLGKGGGSMGAYLLTDKITKEYIINKGKKFIYTTAPPPITTGWNLYILRNMPNFSNRIDKLQKLTQYTLEKLNESQIETISSTQIISVIIGDNERCQTLCDNLREKGYLLFPIKEPTVPRGTARIRIGLNSSLEFSQIDTFIKELKIELNNFL